MFATKEGQFAAYIDGEYVCSNKRGLAALQNSLWPERKKVVRAYNKEFPHQVTGLTKHVSWFKIGDENNSALTVIRKRAHGMQHFKESSEEPLVKLQESLWDL